MEKLDVKEFENWLTSFDSKDLKKMKKIIERQLREINEIDQAARKLGIKRKF
ncbi:MAG: hypothetical protein QXU18_08750 [Thermoplasmatales archaeon]